MQIIIGLLIAMAVWALMLMLMYIITATLVYICQEINHELRKAKQAFKHSLWDLEWELKHR